MSFPFTFQIKGLEIIRKSSDFSFKLSVPNLNIKQGEKIALAGPSGCGKSTLLDALAMIIEPTSLQSFLFQTQETNPIDIKYVFKQKNAQNEVSKIRMQSIGYVLQTGGLLPFLTVEENIGVSLQLLGIKNQETIGFLANKLGIYQHLNKLPSHLSVGERQRTAIARALVHKPAILVADEPTAALDPSSSDKVMELLISVVEQFSTTLLVASHDLDLLSRFGLKPLIHRFLDDRNSQYVHSQFIQG